MSDVGGSDRVEEVYRAVHPLLWRALLAYTGDREFVSDAEAEAFAQALRRGDAVVDVEAWVWRSAFRIAGGLLSLRSSSMAVASVDHVPPASGSVVEFLGLLTNLPAQQRACVALDPGDDTLPQIAELLGTVGAGASAALAGSCCVAWFDRGGRECLKTLIPLWPTGSRSMRCRSPRPGNWSSPASSTNRPETSTRGRP